MAGSTIAIGVVSDTHMFSRGVKLPEALKTGLAGVDLIVHAGDFTDPSVISLFESIAPLEAVAGNNDGSAVWNRFGSRSLFEAGGRRIGIVHGHEGPGRTTEEKARLAFRNEQVDIVIFGHSHVPHKETVHGTLLFNPGSPTDKRWQPRFSFGMITLGVRTIAEHRYYDDKS